MTCEAHFCTEPCYSNQKSCVKIWLELVQPLKSYRGNIPKKKKKKKKSDATENNMLRKNSLPGTLKALDSADILALVAF